MRFSFIDVEKLFWQVTAMCRVLLVSKSGYYAWRKRPESGHEREDYRLGVLVGEAHARSRMTCGSPRIRAALRAKGDVIRRKRVVRLLQGIGLRGCRPRRRARTTESVAGAIVRGNLLDREFTASGPTRAG